MEHLGNSNKSSELDASPLPPLSDRIRFFQQGGKLAQQSRNNNSSMKPEDEEEHVEPPIDYSSLPPVSVRKMLFSSDRKINYDTTTAGSCSSSPMATKGLTRSPAHRQKAQSLSSSSSFNNENSVGARAKLLDEKALKESKQKNMKLMNYLEEEVEKDIPPELLSLADRVKKFSVSPTKKKNGKKYGAASLVSSSSSSSSSRKWSNNSNTNITSPAPSPISSCHGDTMSPLSSVSSPSYGLSPYNDSISISKIVIEDEELSVESPSYNQRNHHSYSNNDNNCPPPPAPPSHDEPNCSNLSYFRNWKSGNSSSRKVLKLPYHQNNMNNSHNNSSPVDWENDQSSMTSSSVSEITYY